MDSCYTYIWEFLVTPEAEDSFIRHYGPNGSWSRLFRQADGYVETLLLKDRSNPGRYLTIDRWKSAEAYFAFRQQFAEQYEQLDRQHERLTSREASLGEYSEVECAAGV